MNEITESAIQWVRDNYQDHTIDSLCEGLRAALTATPAAQAMPSDAVRDAAREVVDAYDNRFKGGTGRYFGPIDLEVRALASALAAQTRAEQGGAA